MKKITLLLLLIGINLNAQTTYKVGSVFKTKETKTFTVTKNLFDLKITKDDILEITSIECDKVTYKDISTGTETTMPAAEFFNYNQQLFSRYKGVEVGVYTIPFRIRGSGDEFDFEASLSLQTNIVFGFGKRTSNTSWIDVSGGIGITSINLNSTNSNVVDSRTASALTLSLGGVFKPAQNANIGLFIGGDFLGKSDRATDWVYNKNLWLGVGINISFNKIETTDPPTNMSTSK
jgi:hypothetical protein